MKNFEASTTIGVDPSTYRQDSEQLAQAYSKIITQPNRTLTARKDAMNRINQVVTSQSITIIFNRRKTLLDATTTLVTHPKIIVAQKTSELGNIAKNIGVYNAKFLQRQQNFLNAYAMTMRLMSPLSILRKGFAIVKTTDDRIYTGKGELKTGEKLTIILSHEQLRTTLQKQIQKDATDTDL